MIESAARCLNTGGRCLLNLTRKSPRTQRYLHSAFWSHGAGDINLPAWWTMLLRTPQAEAEEVWTNRQLAAVHTILTCISEVGFLDFLYPSRTLAIVQQIVNRNRAGWATRQRIRSVPSASRTYSSIASESENAAGEVEGATARASSLQLVKVEENSPEPSLKHYSNRMEIDSILAELFNSPEDGPHHTRAWHCYENLRNISEDLTSRQLMKMLQYLNTAPTRLSTERVIFLLNQIPLPERSEFHYREAIRAALSQGDIEIAMAFNLESLRRTRSFEGTSSILRHLVERENWKQATEILDNYFDEHARHTAANTDYPGLWDDVDQLPIWDDVNQIPYSVLIKKAAAAAEFAGETAETGTAETVTRSRRFALELIIKAFAVRADEVDVVAHQKLFNAARALIKALETPASLMCNYAIGQLLETNLKVNERIAIEYYRDVRKAEWVPPRKFLDTFLAIFCAARDSTGIFEVIDDYRSHYEDIPMLKLPLVITALSQKGDAESVEGLLREYVERSGKPTTFMFNSLLNAHHRRAEVHHVVKCFHDLQKEYGFVPDRSSWNFVIATHARVGDAEGATSWFDQMDKANIQHDARSYGSLMQMYARGGDLEAVQRLFRQSEAAGIESTIAMIDSLVLVLIKNDRLEDATKLVEEALHMDFQYPRTHMWNYLINAYAVRGDLAMVTETHKRMREAAVPLNATTYAALLHSLALKKQPHAAHKILRLVMPRAGIQPNPLHYATVMAGYHEVELFGEVLMLYCDMLKKKILPTQSTQTVLLRSVAALETQKKDGVKPPKELVRTQAILKQIVAKMNPADLAPNRPVRFVGPNRLDEAFTSTNFSYMIFVYGKRAAFDKVKELYNEYLATATKIQGNIDFNPPIEMLGALLSANAESRDYEEVDRCWKLAVEKAAELARPSSAVSGKPWQALYSRRFILNLPFPIYMCCLETQGRIDNIIATVDSLLSFGYDFHSNSWNTYVQILARNGHEKLAFSICERELMEAWLGWESFGNPQKLMRRFDRLKPDGVRATKRFPAYPTLVYLAAAYIKVRFKGQKEVQELVEVAPKAMNAVANMPQRNDQWQAEILGNA